jgi:hypothetical protein
VHPGGLAGRLPAIGVSALAYLHLVLWPADLHLERFTSVPGWSAAAALGAWGAFALVAFGLCLAARRVRGGWLLLALTVLSYLPASGVVPVYPKIAARAVFTPEHFLYLPLLGLTPLLTGLVAGWWPGRASRAAAVAVGLVLAAWSAVVVDRNRDWRDEEALFRQTIAHQPPTARVWYNLGNLALAAGRLDEAIRLYEAALAREPRDGAAHLNLAIALQRQRRDGEAEAHYRQAIASDPALREAYRGLAGLLAARGEMAEAERLLAQGGLLPR